MTELKAVTEEFDLHALSVFAVNKMVKDGITKHISFVDSEDDITFDLEAGSKIAKVTIEWVDPSEADPEKHKTR